MIDVALIVAPDDPPRAQITLGERSLLPGLTLARVNPALMAEMNLPLETTGVVVVDPGPFAPRVGVRPGDVILNVNGVEVTHPDEAETLLGGQVRRVQMLIQRGNRRISLRFRV